MSKQPLLLDVPKDSPTTRERLEMFKSIFNIWTFNSGRCGLEEPWAALFLNPKPKHYTHPMEWIAAEAQHLEDIQVLCYGRTEREAVSRVCQAQEIPFGL